MARVNQLLVLRLVPKAIVLPQAPVQVSRISAPEPDFSILLLRNDFYLGERPSPANSYALIECADTSLRYDRGKKLGVYARGGVREYWIINLVDRCVEIHRQPHELGYTTQRIHRPGETVAFAAIPDVTFTVDEILGPPP
ncbi:MAG: Uma2 family endonuclease [Candidatus Eremiobacteraeota bacterium]|nr:Uma2 family endonuclease [Candidatus Eremiobacteraeota bacterium]MBC5802109.1 Uma2 family endonuclease [Candidatus Eremiobacteraeota bacterium]MBC5824313.1 Uma2 family endonuclease [Candidatus Eremiobacteraeota bacterium]